MPRQVLGRPPTTEAWKQRVRTLHENLGWSAKEISESDPEAPSERQAYRILAVFRGLPESERRQYRWVRWPESFEHGGLPWESAPVVLQLVRDCDADTGERPNVRFARWYWRVAQSAPGIDQKVARRMASDLALAEMGVAHEPDVVYRGVEAALLGKGGKTTIKIEPHSDRETEAFFQLLVQGNPDRYGPRRTATTPSRGRDSGHNPPAAVGPKRRRIVNLGKGTISDGTPN